MADHGAFYWNELMTREPEKACAFYTETLGWRFEDMPMPDGVYRVAKQGDRPVAGMFEMKGQHFEGVPPHWFAYIAVDDVDQRLAAARQAGAEVLREPFEVEGVGRIVIIKDPTGAAIGWITPTSG
jgi:predicted enzyme related to lactoylglutathione lyase